MIPHSTAMQLSVLGQVEEQWDVSCVAPALLCESSLLNQQWRQEDCRSQFCVCFSEMKATAIMGRIVEFNVFDNQPVNWKYQILPLN